MPFKELSIMEQRLEFTFLAIESGLTMSELCRRYNISRRTGYKWVERYTAHGIAGLQNQSRRPHRSPKTTSSDIERYIVSKRLADPEWGPKKLYAILKTEQDQGKYPFTTVPCKNTINRILQRNGLINTERSRQSKKIITFEYDYPNELWQMDFKGPVDLLNRSTCHPLTITDDHSRFNICLKACDNQREDTVKQALINAFRTYGMPYKILTDNGPPWGTIFDNSQGLRAFTKLEKWLLQLNVFLIHGRPYHPQTQGKEERFQNA